MRNVPKIIFPFLWIEEGAVVPNLYVKLLKYSLILYANFAEFTIIHFHVPIENENKRFIYISAYCRLQRINWSIIVASLIGAPIAAICSFILHLLIKYKKIQVISQTIGSAFKKVQTKITETAQIAVNGIE